MSTLDCIELILKKTGRAMSVAELLPLMLESGEWICETANPENSIRTQLNVDLSRKGEKSRFCRPERGRFALKGTTQSPATQVPATDDLGYFYILVNSSFASRWIKILTSNKPIAQDGSEINDSAVPLSYEVFSAYKTHRFTSARTALFGMLIKEEKNLPVEPHENFFRICPTRAHMVMETIAKSFDETDGIYVANMKPRAFELRNPRPPPPDGSTEIYVGNLSYNTTEDELKAAFVEFGTVVSVRIITQRSTGLSKGFGFVRMQIRSEAEKACAALNRRVLGDRTLTVNIAKNVVSPDFQA